MLTKIFGWFYFSINLGAFASQIMTPVLLDRFGPHIAFGVPGGLMLLATIVFWMGRREFVHIPAGGIDFLRETFSKEGLKIIGRLCIIYLFVAVFWSLFDQSGSKWVLQADRMDRNWLGIEWLPSQINAINPIMIMVFIPIFAWLIYPGLNKVFPLTPLRKMGIGFFVAVPSFLIPAWIEMQINAGHLPNIIWQLLAYVFLTAAEVFISITALEFSYTQAPKKMKSLILGFFLISVSMGNLFTAGVNHFIQNESPGFTPDVKGTYVVRLKANDGETTVDREITINAVEELPEDKAPPQDRRKPGVSAGHFRAVPAGELVRLYGTASKGDYNGAFRYSWNWVQLPKDSQLDAAALKLANTRNPHFTPDVEGNYELLFTVQVGESKEATASSRVLIQVTDKNLPPVVQADDNATVAIGKTTALLGMDSFDPNGDELTYEWSVVSAPDGSNVTTKTLTGRQFAGPSSKLKGPHYYLFFAGAMLLAALLFIPVARWYQPKEYLQDEADDAGSDANDTDSDITEDGPRAKPE